MNVLDLFSGIGGFSLGLERAGMRTVGFCEIESWCRAVLAKHWPGVPCDCDITTREFIEGEADVVCGGFPCQDISLAGEGAGLAGSRSGLWRELLRAIRVVRPRFAIVENVAALLARGMGRVLGDLAEIGGDAEWHCIPARAIGAPHLRDRLWIIANPGYWGEPEWAWQERRENWEWPAKWRFPGSNVEKRDVANSEGRSRRLSLSEGREDPDTCWGCETLADSILSRLERSPILAGYIADELSTIERGSEIPDAACELPHGSMVGPEQARCRESSNPNWWLVEPDVGRVAHGVPSRVDRLKGLGNAVIPQIPEIIGRAIMKAMQVQA
jgi:DNA (cytosine-5)-methyltransferase 1